MSQRKNFRTRRLVALPPPAPAPGPIDPREQERREAARDEEKRDR